MADRANDHYCTPSVEQRLAKTKARASKQPSEGGAASDAGIGSTGDPESGSKAQTAIASAVVIAAPPSLPCTHELSRSALARTIADLGFMLLKEMSSSLRLPLDRRDCAICTEREGRARLGRESTNQRAHIPARRTDGFSRKPFQAFRMHVDLALRLSCGRFYPFLLTEGGSGTEGPPCNPPPANTSAEQRQVETRCHTLSWLFRREAFQCFHNQRQNQRSNARKCPQRRRLFWLANRWL